jgi:tetratricopeptide (TPR) repeat protein
LVALVDELRDARGGLDAFMGESDATDVRAVFSWSYRTLSPKAAMLFRWLGLHPGPHVTAPSAASLAGVTVAETRRLLAELVAAHLLEERTPGRFTFHDLLRAYATEQVHAVDGEAERRAAIGRLLDHYLQAVYAAERLLYPDRQTDEPPPPRSGVTPVPLSDPDRALAWFTAEHPVLLAAVELAAGTGFDGEVWQLAWMLTHYLNFQGHWHDWAASLHAALAAARRLTDYARQADAHRVLGLAYLQLCRFDDAYAHAQRALDLFQQLGGATETDQARAHLGLGFVLEQQGHHADALHHAEQALDLYRTTGNRTGESNALNWIGWYHTLLGHHEHALSYGKRSLDLKRELGDPYGEAETWNTFGHAHHHLGQPDEAITCYQRALRLWRQLNDPYEESRTLLRLGEALHTTADSGAARAAWHRALEILDQLGHPTAERVRAKLYPTSADGSSDPH